MTAAPCKIYLSDNKIDFFLQKIVTFFIFLHFKYKPEHVIQMLSRRLLWQSEIKQFTNTRTLCEVTSEMAN